MPASVSAALILRRGTQGLTLEQLNRLIESEGQVNAILDRIETERQAFLSVKAGAEKAAAAAHEKRLAEIAQAEDALAAREQAHTDAVQAFAGELASLVARHHGEADG